MSAGPLTLLLAALALAVLFLGIGTLRGSYRFWLVGYALAVAALVIAYAGVHAGARP